jgi:predicted ABC-class ATPase
MKTSEDLKQILERIDHRGYPAYKDTRGVYQFGTYILGIDHVQGDPFAAPSRLHIQVAGRAVRIPKELYDSKHKKTAVADYLLRNFAKQLERHSFQAHGSGKSGIIQVTRCGQEVLERTACEIDEKTGDVTVRFEVGFPARGRTIQAGELVKILYQYLPACVEKALYYKNMDRNAVKQAAELSVDQEYIREQLKKEGLVAFVADGSILPRESGVSQRPMKDAVPFASPDSMRITMKLPYKGMLTGMGIRKGVTLIVGGGYHGKSTLLNALELGIYDHISGDGREYVITDPSAQKLRSEDGRFIKDVDISLFINDLPNKKDTLCFSTEDASGSTSQAAGIVESMEAGSKVFLLDEDTSATNFMVRDSFMQRVICREKEPITPFLERARDLYEKAGISTILVAGSSGAFFHIADTVIQMDNYHPVDITAVTKKLCQEYPLSDIEAPAFRLPENHRIMTRAQVAPSRHSRPGQPERLKTKVHGKDGFSLGKTEVDLRYVEQLIDSEQTASLALLLKYACEHLIDGKRTLPEIITYLDTQLKRQGLSFFSEGSYIPCGYAMPRIQEIYSCFNRYRRP